METLRRSQRSELTFWKKKSVVGRGLQIGALRCQKGCWSRNEHRSLWMNEFEAKSFSFWFEWKGRNLWTRFDSSGGHRDGAVCTNDAALLGNNVVTPEGGMLHVSGTLMEHFVWIFLAVNVPVACAFKLPPSLCQWPTKSMARKTLGPGRAWCSKISWNTEIPLIESSWKRWMGAANPKSQRFQVCLLSLTWTVGVSGTSLQSPIHHWNTTIDVIVTCRTGSFRAAADKSFSLILQFLSFCFDPRMNGADRLQIGRRLRHNGPDVFLRRTIETSTRWVWESAHCSDDGKCLLKVKSVLKLSQYLAK